MPNSDRACLRLTVAAILALGLLGACVAPGTGPIEPAAGPPEEQDPEFESAQRIVAAAAAAKRDAARQLTFEQFLATVYKEPFEGGKYIVDGDTALVDLKQLQDFFQRKIQRDQLTPMLTINTVHGQDTIWSSQEKTKLTYCISTAFGSRYQAVQAAMATASAAWQTVAQVAYRHLPAEDRNCRADNSKVTFDIRPVDVGGEYLARAFFPNEPRPARNLLIDDSAFALPSAGKLKLAGILRHELGHTLGFRHEHTRPEAGRCFEDADWRPLTRYDPFSVMHYPQCKGLGDWSLTLTALDRNGAACLYGPANNFPVSTTDCPGGRPIASTPSGSAATPITLAYQGQAVAKGAEQRYGPFPVSPGSLLEVSMAGRGSAGDPDLYVRFERAPSLFAYDCRPFLAGATERCALDVPTGMRQAFVTVRGYEAGRYDLKVTHAPPAVAAVAMPQVLAAR